MIASVCTCYIEYHSQLLTDKCRITTQIKIFGFYTQTIRHSVPAQLFVIYSYTDQTNARSVRLIGGSDSCDGIVEIAYDGRWGMVCDESFSLYDAQAVCEELGYDRKGAEVVQLFQFR